MGNKHTGRLELTWTDKDKTLLSTGDGQYDYTFVQPSDYRVSEIRLLHEVARIEAPTPYDRPKELPEPTNDNLLITGDSMHVLDALAKVPEYAEKYLGKIRLVYIDPPFNTEQTFLHYEDSIEHSIWLTMLRDRIRQIKPLLTNDGSIWVHLDDKEVHRCRVVLDEEMGADNFIAEVMWEKADSPNNSARYLSKDTDTILVYARNKKAWRPNRLPRSAAFDAIYTNPDNDHRGRWYPGDPYANKPYSLGLYEITGPTGRTFKPPKGRFWRVSEDKFWELDAENRIFWGPDKSARPSIKRYLSEVTGMTPRTLWRHADVGSNRTSKNEMRRLFPEDASFATPKPEKLLQRILQIGSSPGDIVLDCYGGSGTTAAVAHKMGRRWVTSELLSETVEAFTKSRLTRVVQGDDSGGITTETIRVEAEGVELPKDITPEQAQEFNKLLNKISEADDSIEVQFATELAKMTRTAQKNGDSPLDKDESKELLRLLKKFAPDGAPVDIGKTAKSALYKRTKTRNKTTKLWHGGGSFTHLEVGPSMFEQVEEIVLLADWATRGALAEAMCAQLEVWYQPDGIFAASRGKTRYIVIDGHVGESTILSILDQLQDGYIVEVWATQYDDVASDLLRTERPGSRLEAIPDSVLDRYRRKATNGSPFQKEKAYE
ncbi:site-specific DNA-methyltransferase [Halomonas nitroreducens]|uniref:site-specific DNA-methyltransferase (adenine-specific) n=1 Tax=Halomonas nitroreducens TaxID=447425 RepID=A0A431V4C7_9GAMM|nr:site-specific DNA-methyltransferase [Halomonas nitroreducens]